MRKLQFNAIGSQILLEIDERQLITCKSRLVIPGCATINANLYLK